LHKNNIIRYFDFYRFVPVFANLKRRVLYRKQRFNIGLNILHANTAFNFNLPAWFVKDNFAAGAEILPDINTSAIALSWGKKYLKTPYAAKPPALVSEEISLNTSSLIYW
jgi:hypothetical protein